MLYEENFHLAEIDLFRVENYIAYMFNRFLDALYRFSGLHILRPIQIGILSLHPRRFNYCHINVGLNASMNHIFPFSSVCHVVYSFIDMKMNSLILSTHEYIGTEY